MARQLQLLEVPERQWRLDDETRRVGLAGVAAAREALRAARRHQLPEDAVDGHAHPEAA